MSPLHPERPSWLIWLQRGRAGACGQRLRFSMGSLRGGRLPGTGHDTDSRRDCGRSRASPTSASVTLSCYDLPSRFHHRHSGKTADHQASHCAVRRAGAIRWRGDGGCGHRAVAESQGQRFSRTRSCRPEGSFSVQLVSLATGAKRVGLSFSRRK